MWIDAQSIPDEPGFDPEADARYHTLPMEQREAVRGARSSAAAELHYQHFDKLAEQSKKWAPYVGSASETMATMLGGVADPVVAAEMIAVGALTGGAGVAPLLASRTAIAVGSAIAGGAAGTVSTYVNKAAGNPDQDYMTNIAIGTALGGGTAWLFGGKQAAALADRPRVDPALQMQDALAEGADKVQTAAEGMARDYGKFDLNTPVHPSPVDDETMRQLEQLATEAGKMPSIPEVRSGVRQEAVHPFTVGQWTEAVGSRAKELTDRIYGAAAGISAPIARLWNKTKLSSDAMAMAHPDAGATNNALAGAVFGGGGTNVGVPAVVRGQSYRLAMDAGVQSTAVRVRQLVKENHSLPEAHARVYDELADVFNASEGTSAADWVAEVLRLDGELLGRIDKARARLGGGKQPRPVGYRPLSVSYNTAKEVLADETSYRGLVNQHVQGGLTKEADNVLQYALREYTLTGKRVDVNPSYFYKDEAFIADLKKDMPTGLRDEYDALIDAWGTAERMVETRSVPVLRNHINVVEDMARHSHAMSNLAALSEVGIFSFGRVDEIKAQVMQEALQAGKTQAQVAGEVARVENLFSELQTGRYGRGVSVWADRIADATSIVQLPMSGLNNIVDFAAGTTQFGFAQTMKHLPEFTRMVRPGYREELALFRRVFPTTDASKPNMALVNEVIDGMPADVAAKVRGATDEQTAKNLWLHMESELDMDMLVFSNTQLDSDIILSPNIRLDREEGTALAQSAYALTWANVDKVTAHLQRAQMYTSMSRPLTVATQALIKKPALNELCRLASTPGASIPGHWLDAGLTEDMLARIGKQLAKHATWEDGVRVIKDTGSAKWDGAVRDEVQALLSNTISVATNQAITGSAPGFMKGNWGRILGQYQRVPMRLMETRALQFLRYHDAAAVRMMAASAVGSYLYAQASEGMKMWADPEREGKNTAQLLRDAASFVPVSGFVPTALDLLDDASGNMMTNQMDAALGFDPQKPRAFDLGSHVPAARFLSGAATLPFQLSKSAVTGEWQPEATAALQQSIPFLNHVAVQALINHDVE